MKINSDKLNDLNNQFNTMRDFSNRNRDIVPFVLDEFGGRYPLINVKVIDKPIKTFNFKSTNNQFTTDVTDTIIKVLLKHHD